MKRYPIILSLLLSIISCQKFEQNNPFDSNCPKEIWTPTNFSAVQEGTTIKLTWSQPFKNIAGFKLTRKIDTGSATDLQAQTKDATQFVDASLTGGKVHIYTIVAFAGNNISNVITVQITPILTATISTSLVSIFSFNAAILGGNTISDGGATITQRGVCYGISRNPTLSNSVISMGIGIGSFSFAVTGLSPMTTYYARSYATNNQGTSYGNEVNFKTSAPLSQSGTVTDIDGNIYNTVTIGSQVWMAENLKTTKYNDGISIPNITDFTAWSGLNTPAYCWYGNDYLSYKNSYGALYNWYAVNTGKLAPQGWHIPTSDEWTIFMNFIGSSVLSAKIKMQFGWDINVGTNETGFSLLPAGFRAWDNGSFQHVGYAYNYWLYSVNPNVSGVATGYVLTDWTGGILMTTNGGLDAGLKSGKSIRCLKDAGSTLSTTSVSSITSTSVVSGGTIISDGGTTVTARGVCWSTTTGPTILNSKTANGSGVGSFSSSLTGLTPQTTYFLRAYATNSAGTNYGNEVSFTTQPAPIMFNLSKSYGSLTDVEGNVYKTIVIGTQTWMAENLKTTKYKDGTVIPLVTDNTAWANLITPGFCWYSNDATTYRSTYGALYNWNTVNTGKLCPTGWHVPSDADWTTLTTYLGGESVVGGKLKETGTSHWYSPNISATNETGFTAVPGGFRDQHGTFYNVGYYGSGWSSAESSTTYAWARGMFYDYSRAERFTIDKQYGFSVRCISGELTLPPISNPSNITVCQGSNATFTVSGGTTYQWELSTNSGTSWSSIAGQISPTLTLIAVISSINGYKFRCQINGTPSNAATLTVNPTPSLTSSLTPPAICSGTAFNYIPSSLTAGSTFTWTRAVVAGISNPPAAGTGNPNEMLNNVTAAPISVTYSYTLNANACTNPTSYNVVVVVNPTPLLTSPPTPPSICSGTVFSYIPTTSTPGVTFSWIRPVVAGISNAAGAGTGNPNEPLVNITAVPVSVTYIYTLNYQGCTKTFNVTVVVNPNPSMASSLTPPSICSGTVFSYNPTSTTPGVTFGWTRALVTGISNSASSGVGNPNEMLINVTSSPVAVTYIYSLSANGCTNPIKYYVVETINPTPAVTTSNKVTISSGTNSNINLTSSSPSTFTWSVGTIIGGISGADSGTGSSINQILTNPSSSVAGSVQYIVTPTAVSGSCAGSPYTITVTVNPAPATVADVDGNVYNTVTIGTQVWMKENLNTSKLNDGVPVNLVTDKSSWQSVSYQARCYMNYDAATYMTTYGALYNWAAVSTNKLCPNGWHVPTNTEWTILTNYLGGESVAGGKLKETGISHWINPNTGATNESGFTALPYTLCDTSGLFGSIGSSGYWWSSTESSSLSAWHVYLFMNDSKTYNYMGDKKFGMSVRCLKN